METMTAKLLAEIQYGRQRIYRLSQPIKKGFHFVVGEHDIKDILFDAKKNLNDEWKHLIPGDAPNAWDIVCVSDAHTHTERLVFLGFHDEESGQMGRLSGISIDGKMTMMIHGGDARSVHPDKVYLRRLASLNGYKFGGIVPATEMVN